MQMAPDYFAGKLLIVLILGGTGLLLLIMGINNAQSRRAWEHAERMKAMEMGYTLPARDSSWARASVCIAIGAIVPIVSMCLGVSVNLDPIHRPELWWFLSSVVAITGVGCGFKLASRMFRPDDDTRAARAAAKPVSDPEAFDFAGRRG